MTQKRTSTLMIIFLLATLFLSSCASSQTATASQAAPKTTDVVPTEIPATATSAPTTTIAPTEAPTAANTPVQVQQAGQAVQISELAMSSAQEGWAIDANARILRTDQGPESWKDVTPVDAWSADGTRVTAAFLNQQEAWAVYTSTSNPDLSMGVDVWHTSDGGATWEKLGKTPVTEELSSMVEIQFVDSEHGWILGQIYPGMMHCYAVIYATTDGGKTWTKAYDQTADLGASDTLTGSYSLPYGNHVFTFVSTEVGFAGSINLYATQDGGTTWKTQTLPELPNLPTFTQAYPIVTPPQFATANDGILVESIYEFEQVDCPPCDTTRGMPVVEAVYVTHDEGKTWTAEKAPAALGTAVLFDSQTGWFLGINDAAQTTTSVYKTSDGGATWTEISKNSGLPLGSKMGFVTDQIGFAWNPYATGGMGNSFQNVAAQVAAGQDPYVYQTVDGGATWVKLQPTVTP